MPDAAFETLWQTVSAWRCDYAEVVNEAKGKKPPLAVNVHLDSCKKCQLLKRLLLVDELLKRMTDITFEDFQRTYADEGAGDMTEPEFDATVQHAELMRTDIIGCPRG